LVWPLLIKGLLEVLEKEPRKIEKNNAVDSRKREAVRD